jgi:hypothetical protein
LAAEHFWNPGRERIELITASLTPDNLKFVERAMELLVEAAKQSAGSDEAPLK